MKKLRWYPHYIDDYRRDTEDLVAEEHGAYRLLLDALFDQGRLLSDPRLLRRIARVSPQRWKKVWAVIARFFDQRDGFITQKRMTEERARAKELSNQRAVAGMKGNQVRWRENGASLIHPRPTPAEIQNANSYNGPPIANGTQIASPGDPPLPSRSIITTSVPSSARASSSGPGGPPTRSESPEQNNSQGGVPEKLRHLPTERQEVVLQAYRRMARDPATGKKLRA